MKSAPAMPRACLIGGNDGKPIDRTSKSPSGLLQLIINSTNYISLVRKSDMSRVKIRNLLVLCHLFLAALIAPLFILLAMTGFNYLTGNKGETVETALTIPAGTRLEPESATIEDDVRAVLKANDLPTDFEYLRTGSGSITTRPTSREFVAFKEEDGVWSAALNQPNLQYRMMELHKGHGPEKFKIYQIIAAIALFLIVIGGVAVGLMAPGYRKKTLGSLVVGVAAFVLLAFVI